MSCLSCVRRRVVNSKHFINRTDGITPNVHHGVININLSGKLNVRSAKKNSKINKRVKLEVKVKKLIKLR